MQFRNSIKSDDLSSNASLGFSSHRYKLWNLTIFFQLILFLSMFLLFLMFILFLFKKQFPYKNTG